MRSRSESHPTAFFFGLSSNAEQREEFPSTFITSLTGGFTDPHLCSHPVLGEKIFFMDSRGDGWRYLGVQIG